MSLAGLAIAIVIMFTTKAWNDHANRPRRVKYYREEEVQKTADSLLDNWLENEMKMYEEDSQVYQSGSGPGKPGSQGAETQATAGKEMERE